MIPVEFIFWSHPDPSVAVKTQPGKGWQFPAGASTASVVRLQDWIGPWNEIYEAYWRSECCYDPRVAGNVSATVGVQLVAMPYNTVDMVVLQECEFLCTSPQSAPYNKCVTAKLKEVFSLATPARNDAIQLGVRIKSDAPALVYSSRLMIAWKTA